MGMIAEAQHLHNKGLTYTRMHTLGLEYRALANFLTNKINKQELIEQLNRDIYQYAKRQIQWFKRDTRIKWFDVEKNISEREIMEFLKL